MFYQRRDTKYDKRNGVITYLGHWLCEYGGV